MKKLICIAKKVVTFSNGQSSTLAYMVREGHEGFGKSSIVFTNYSGQDDPVGKSIEVPESSIQKIEGSDGKVREWLV